MTFTSIMTTRYLDTNGNNNNDSNNSTPKSTHNDRSLGRAYLFSDRECVCVIEMAFMSYTPK